MSSETIRLNNGVEMPLVGLGTWDFFVFYGYSDWCCFAIMDGKGCSGEGIDIICFKEGYHEKEIIRFVFGTLSFNFNAAGHAGTGR